MGKTIFFLAHHDDEFGIFEEIRIHINQKIPFHIAYLTSSNKIREQESLSVLRKLGVKRHQISFIGKELSIQDLALKDHLVKAFIKSKLLIKKLGNVQKIFTHAYEGGHPDHDSLNFLCAKILSKSRTKINGWQFPLYCGPGLIGPLFFLFKPLKRNGSATVKKIKIKYIIIYLRLILIYKSQIKTFIGLFPFYFLHMLINQSLLMQRINPLKPFTKPHKGKLLYERRKMDKFENLKSKFKEFDNWQKKNHNVN